MLSEIDKLVRPNILELRPYSSARSEFDGAAEVFLDANENAHGSPAGGDLNRYPDPLQHALKEQIAAMNGLEPQSIFVGNGSDEAIDLLFRIFCRPGVDRVITTPPTYGMYSVAAAINDVQVEEVALDSEFQLRADAVIRAANSSPKAKLIFICSPNNPTGNAMRRDDILRIARETEAIVAVDEAYIHFSGERSVADEIRSMPNLVVLQTLSKAWGMAGLRIGFAFADRQIIELMNKVKPPYNVSAIAQRSAIAALSESRCLNEWLAQTISERERLRVALDRLHYVEKVFPSDANFLLVRMRSAEQVFKYLRSKAIIVRDRSRIALCNGCLRITIGTAAENSRLIAELENFRNPETEQL